MNTISLRLPSSLHEQARELAKREHTSINHLITLALAEKVAALATEEYLGRRAMRGDRARFEQAMSKVADVEPEERDRLDAAHFE